MKFNILFSLPTLSLQHSKMPRVLEICKSLDRQMFQPVVSVDHEGRLNKYTVSLLNDLDIPIEILRLSPHYSHPVDSTLDLVSSIRDLHHLDITIQYSSDYSKQWTEPLIARLSGVRHWIMSKTNSDFSNLNWFIKLLFAKKIILQSPTMKDVLVRKYPCFEDKSIVIPNGVDTKVFFPKPPNESLRDDLNVPGYSLVLGCIAHISPVKSHLEIIKALKKVKSKQQILLLVVGKPADKEYFQVLEQFINNNNLEKNVVFTGMRKDIPDLCSIMDGLVFSRQKRIPL